MLSSLIVILRKISHSCYILTEPNKASKQSHKISLTNLHIKTKLTFVTWQLDKNSAHKTEFGLQSMLMKTTCSLCKPCWIWQRWESAVIPEHNKCIGFEFSCLLYVRFVWSSFRFKMHFRIELRGELKERKKTSHLKCFYWRMAY